MGMQFPGLGVYQQAFDKHTIQDVNDSSSQGELDDSHQDCSFLEESRRYPQGNYTFMLSD